MKILILNGSPKGRYSITLQTSNYLEILHPEHEYDVLHLGATIKSLERDFGEARAKLEWADLLIFSYPVYTFIAPCQLHKFIELVKKNNSDSSLGSAMMAGVVGGLFASYEDAIAKCTLEEGRTVPNPENHEKYALLYEKYKAIHDALEDVYHKYSAI